MTDRVARLELFHVAAPLPAVFHPAWIPGYPQAANRFTLARVTTKSGKVGLAAGAAFGEEREGLGDVIGPYLVDADALDLPEIHQRLEELAFLGWRNFWLEAAFHDIAAQHAGVPLWKHLGGREPALRVYASTGEVRAPDSVSARVRQLAARGFPLVKIRVHSQTLGDDVAQLKAAAKAARDTGVELAVDANQGWRVTLFENTPKWDLNRALAFAKECHAADVKWLEEPLDHHDYDGYRELRKS
ncbi:MAG: mandelate racemase/muconate lactonizing enzyme family protein, partial [Thermoplasmatota archaeon]